MCHTFKILWFILLLNLAACGDETPRTPKTETANSAQPKALGKLKLSVPNLIGWGKVSEIKITVGDSMEVLATLQDGEGTFIADKPLFITSKLGNFFTQNSFTTDQHGEGSTLLLATVIGQDVITVTNQAGLTATLSVTVSDPETAAANASNIPPLAELPGVLSWQTLAKVTVKEDVPTFHKEVQALQGKEVKVQGFIMPLDNAEKQKHFLLSVSPPSCFYCLPAGPEGVVEVYSQQAVEFSYEPLIVSGKLQILSNDEMGLFYRIENAQPVKL